MNKIWNLEFVGGVALMICAMLAENLWLTAAAAYTSGMLIALWFIDIEIDKMRAYTRLLEQEIERMRQLSQRVTEFFDKATKK